MKTLLFTVAAVALGSGLIAGVTPARAEDLQLVEVSPNPPRTELLKSLIAGFEQENPGTHVNLISLPWDSAFEKLLTMVQSGQTIDVSELPDRWVSLYAANHQIEDLSPYLAKWPGAQTLTQSAFEMSKLGNEKPYFLTYGAYIRALIYNPVMFKAAGIDKPPQTLDEMLHDSQHITEALPGKYGFCFRGGRGGFVEWWQLISDMRGDGKWFDSSGNSTFDTPEAIQGMKIGVDIYQKGWSPKDSVGWGFNESVAGFYSGTCAMLDSDPDVVDTLTTHMGADGFATTPIPLGPKGVAAPAVGIFGWAMFSKTHKDKSWALISYLSTLENNLKWAKFVGVIPIHKGADKDPFYSGPKYSGWFAELDNPKYVLTPPPGQLKELGYFFDTLSVQGSQQMLTGQKPVEEVAASWAKYLSAAQKKWLASTH